MRHVQEQFYCADPTTYKQVLRSIRISKNSKADRAYAIGMYTNSSNVTVCQMCRKPDAFIEAPQIANFGIEMPQLNLCLCRRCAARYSQIRDVKKDEYKKRIKEAIKSLDVEEGADEYSIEINSEMCLYFTQTHIAEIQEIFRLLAEYGTPSESDEQDDDISGPLMHTTSKRDDNIVQEKKKSDVATEGQFIAYKKKFGDYEIYDNVLQPRKFKLHQVMEGHKVGDVVTYMGKQYEIIGL